MPKLVGREPARDVFRKVLKSGEPELVAVYGRRRVGKTFLVREFFADRLCFELTGSYGAPLGDQFGNFRTALRRAAPDRPEPPAPASWRDAFGQLIAYLGKLKRSERHVVFVDELPWLAARRSGFLPALEHFWNTWASKQPHLIVVICGSAASWMIRNVVQHRGGLHNRITRRIRLEPFTLAETFEFLRSRRVELSLPQVVELYMTMGGVPHYLKEIEPGQSAAQNIDHVCFAPSGLLRDEFGKLYTSLFEHADRHIRVIRAMAKLRRGMTRNEVLDAAGMPTGGAASGLLDELVESGFVARTAPHGKGRKDAMYRLADEYSLFYLNWIESHRGSGADTWLKLSATPSWRAWSGYAFEGICLKHVRQIKRALGIEGVETTEAAWAFRPSDRGQRGAQIDLVIDRRDACINLCEMKFSQSEFVIDKRYAAELRNKRDIFREVTGTRKTLFLTMVTANGVRENEYRRELVTQSITADKLFA